MDDTSKHLIDHFIEFMVKELQSDKHLKQVQFEKWSLKDFRITVPYFYHDKKGSVAIDLRELKENENHFLHLIGNVREQMATELGIIIKKA
jgi:hypothetical protein